MIGVIGLPVFGVVARMFRASFEKITKWYLAIALFAVVVVMDSIFFPFIGGKDWFFRFAVELALASFVLWWAFEAKDGEAGAMIRHAFRQPIVIAASAFAVVALLSSIFAYDAYAAFWSNYERGEGVFQLLHYYIFFVLLVMVVRTAEEWISLFKNFLWASAAMIGYGILANLGTATYIGPYSGQTAPAGFWGKIVLGRFQGSLGNPAYVAPYLIFSIFFAAYAWIKGHAIAASRVLRSWIYAILIAVFFVFFILSQTRGAFIGLGVGIIVFLIYLAFSKNKALRKWSLAAIGILVVLGAVGYSVRNVPAIQNLPEGRLLQISTSDSTAQTRFWVWNEAWKGFLERPILGWGPENFTAVYDKFFDSRFYIPGQPTETWFDRAHSVFLDYLSEMGILGLAAYISMFVAFYIGFFRLRRRANDRENSTAAHAIERGLVFAVPIAYLVQGVAIFDVLPMYIALFFFLAFATWYETKN